MPVAFERKLAARLDRIEEALRRLVEMVERLEHRVHALEHRPPDCYPATASVVVKPGP